MCIIGIPKKEKNIEDIQVNCNKTSKNIKLSKNRFCFF